MADLKIPALPELTTVENTDLFEVVDVSDTTDDAGGTSKKITGNNLLKILNAIKSNSDGSTVTFDMSEHRNHSVVLGGNRTLAVSNVSVGQIFTVKLTQDGTGSRTVTWWNGITWVDGGTAPTLTTTLNKSDRFMFICTASNIYEGYVVGQNF